MLVEVSVNEDAFHLGQAIVGEMYWLLCVLFRAHLWVRVPNVLYPAAGISCGRIVCLRCGHICREEYYLWDDGEYYENLKKVVVDLSGVSDTRNGPYR